MLVKEIMTHPVITIDFDKTVFEASIMYRDHKIGCLIITRDGKCAGIVTERDLIERTICQKRDPYTTKIGDIMTTDIKTIHELDTLEKAIETMTMWRIKKLPVVRGEDIIGIITAYDISKARPDISKRFVETWVKPRWKD